MPEPTIPGLMLWPGVAQPLRGSFTLSHGTSPSVATIELTPQTGVVATEGTLAVTYAGVTVGFPGCRVKEGSLQYTRSGRLWQLSIEDTRWRWQYGEISGVYNRRTPDGELEDAAVLPGGDLPPRIKTPQQLALLCWQAMPWDGVTGFDLSLLPNDGFPTVEWDCENPAQALERLCEDLGCRVVYSQPGLVRLLPLGLGGAALPGAGLLQQTDTAAPPPPPRWIEVVGEPIRYQTYLKLEAVGEDTDGRTVPIADLSYTPAAGWGGEIPPDFAGVAAGRSRALAQKTVYRWYRVSADSPVLLDNGGACIVGWDGFGYGIENPGRRVSFRWQLEGFDNTQAIQGNDPLTNARAPIPAAVIGRWTTGRLGFVDSTEGDPYPHALVIDGEHGLVQFADHVWRVNAGQVEPAALYLVVAVSPRDPDTGAVTRFRYRVEASPIGGGVLTVRRDDIKCYVIGTYSDDYEGLAVPEGQDNFQACREQAAYYAAAALAEVQDRGGAERTYAGILDVPPDGAIQQVGWETGPQGCTTRLSFHREYDWRVPKYAERRADARLTRRRVEQVAAEAARRREWARRQRRIGP